VNEVHEKCNGCKKVTAELKCSVYVKPSIWWEKRGGCPVATHTVIKVAETKKVNPLKASKKAKKGIR
jgi:hypothetical protein